MGELIRSAKTRQKIKKIEQHANEVMRMVVDWIVKEGISFMCTPFEAE